MIFFIQKVICYIFNMTNNISLDDITRVSLMIITFSGLMYHHCTTQNSLSFVVAFLIFIKLITELLVMFGV